MARPVSIQKDVVLEAARRVFMRDGFKASTARIAREAGVSEGSLFKHFKNKCGLFLAAMDVRGEENTWEQRLRDAAGRDDLATTLEAAGIHILERLRLILPRLMMVNSSGITIPKHDHPGAKPPPLHNIEVICKYFKMEIKAGRLHMASPQAQAHAFMGALAHYAWCETLFGYRAAPPKPYVKSVVNTILKASMPGKAL